MEKLTELQGRTSKVTLNVISGIILQILTLGLNMLVRVTFVHAIGYSYLGISALFANILTVLSVADLGFGTSISISLYAALKKGDKDHIAGIISFYKKIYFIIGGIILIAGLGVCGFVDLLVNTETPIPLIRVYFFIYLINVLATYFISYRHAIIKADQKNGIINTIHSVVLFGKSIVELLILLILPRFFKPQVAYITYLIVMVLSTYISETWCAYKAKKMYPYAFKKTLIVEEEKKEIKKNVLSLLLYKVCYAVNKSADSILISILVSTTILGKYSNYTLIISVLMGFGCIISRNAIASLGNFVLTESKEKQVKMFNLLNFVHIAIAAFFIVNFTGILEPFFKLAFGIDSILSIATLVLTAIHIGFDLNYQVNELFRETTKMFRKIPYISAINLLLNIALSIVLGIYFGLEGILAGTLIAYFLTSFWFETFALFKYYFKTSSIKVWLKLLFAFISIGAFATASYFMTSKIVVGDSIIQFIYSILISLSLSFLCLLTFFWLDEFKEIYRIGKKIVLNIYQKIDQILSNIKFQKTSLLVSVILFSILIAIRDIGGIEINKFAYVALCFISLSLLRKEYLVSYIFFTVPFYAALPNKIIFPLFLAFLIIKNFKIFKNWRLIINYFAIPLLVFILELVLSTLYGQTTSLSIAFVIFAILAIFAFLLYDKKIKSTKPLKYFACGVVIMVGILFICWVRLAAYSSSVTEIKSMTFIKIMTKHRFGDWGAFVEWVELWAELKYPYNTSIHVGDNVNYTGLIMLSAIMVFVYLLTQKDKKSLKLLYFLGILYCGFFGFYTGSKSFFVCLIIFAYLFLLGLYVDGKIKFLLFLLIAGISGGAIAIVCTKVPYVYEYIVSRLNNDSGRFALTGAYVGHIFSHPLQALFGVGASRMFDIAGFSDVIHCSIIQIVGGYGLIGFTILLIGCFLTMKNYRSIRLLDKCSSLTTLVPLLTFILFSLVSQIFLPPNTLIYGIPAFYILVIDTNRLKEKPVLTADTNRGGLKKMIRNIFKKKAQSNEEVVLLTGAAGFIGAALAKKLLEETNYVIVGLDNLNDYYDVSLKYARLKDLKKFDNFKFVKGDISDFSLIENLFEKYHFIYVINLAAQAGVRYSIDHPDVYIQSNIIGFYNILEACRHHPVKHLVYASSSSVYGGNTKVPFSTDDKVDNPVSLYAATKKSNELLAHSYSKLYNIPTTGLRFFTVYGPMGRPDMAYFSFTNKLIKGETIEIFNYGNCKRDFTYVDDIVEGIIQVMNKAPEKKDGEDGLPIPPYKIYNIGNNNPENLLDFVQILSEELVNAGVLAKDYDFEAHKKLVPMQKGDVPITYADTSELEKDFGYKPNTSLREGLRKFAIWYKEFYK